MQACTLSYLCGDTHAARNVHTEHHHSILHILVVIVVLCQQVEVIAAQACVSTGARSPVAGGQTLLTTTELACPHLEKEAAGFIPLWNNTSETKKGSFLKKKKYMPTHISAHKNQTRQGGTTFLTNHWALHVLQAGSCREEDEQRLRVFVSVCAFPGVFSDLGSCRPVSQY